MTDTSLLQIGIDYTAAIHQTAGIGRYVRELVAAMAVSPSRSENVVLHLFVAGAHRAHCPPPPDNCVYSASPISERNHVRLWHRLRLPIPVELWTGCIDLFHAADFALPPTLSGTRAIVTVYDLSFEHYPQDTMPGMLHHLRRVVPRSARRADRVIAISEATRRDLIALYGVHPDKIAVVQPGVSPHFNSRATEGDIRAKYHLPDAPLILTVGTMQPRKNHLRLVQAFAQIETKARLVIAGGQGWAYDVVQQEVTRLGMAERVIFAGFVDDNDLPDLYRAATVFVYPALYEGFGIPVLEAMACGTPVITSNVSSLPEAAGEAAILVDPLNVEELSMTLDRLLSNEMMRNTLRGKGIARAGKFTWARAAEQTWDVYRALLNLPA
ncbi:MAG: glycosyltransferase family 4 protein [Anaerolineae bacterium]|nr:glycosyltransferase family 4 protein [Anaerolineae bacterium]